MTARDIQLTLMGDRFKRSFVLPNYTPMYWFECDVMEITPAGYMKEYEIKISRSDFAADSFKTSRTMEWEGIGRGYRILNKHRALAEHDKVGPSQFSFVVPEGLVTVDETPDWAGLIYVRPRSPGHRHPYRFHLTTVRSAPQLHRHKIDPKIWSHARGVCYYRLHNLLMATANNNASL